MGTVSDVNNISCFTHLVLTFSRYETPVDGYRTVYKETLDTAEKLSWRNMRIIVHTVRAHRKNMLKKTNVNNVCQLLGWAVDNSII